MPVIEHITLQPHPLEGFSRALDALIACAPGDRAEISALLFSAARRTGAGVRLAQPTALQRRCAQRLVLAMDLQPPSEPEFNEAGFPLDSPVIGEPRPLRPADRKATEASPGSPDSAPTPKSESRAAAASAQGGQQHPPFRRALRDAAMHAPARLPGLPASRSDQT